MSAFPTEEEVLKYLGEEIDAGNVDEAYADQALAAYRKKAASMQQGQAVNEVPQQQAVQAVNEVPPAGQQDERGMLDAAWDYVKSIPSQFTGEAKMTPSAERQLSWMKMPELQSIGASTLAALGTAISGGVEDAKIIAKQAGLDFNDRNQVNQDEKGNWYFKSKQDGQWYVQKPGFGWEDALGVAINYGLTKGVGAIATKVSPWMRAMFTPAVQKAASVAPQSLRTLAATSAGKAIGQGAAEETALQGAQSALGGEFNPTDIPITGGASGVLDLGGSLVRFRGVDEDKVSKIATDVAKGDTTGLQGLPAKEAEIVSEMANRIKTKAGIGQPVRALDEVLAEKAVKRGKLDELDIIDVARTIETDQDRLNAVRALGLTKETNVAQMMALNEKAQIQRGVVDSLGLNKKAFQNSFELSKKIRDAEKSLNTKSYKQMDKQIKTAFNRDFEIAKAQEKKAYDGLESYIPKENETQLGVTYAELFEEANKKNWNETKGPLKLQEQPEGLEGIRKKIFNLVRPGKGSGEVAGTAITGEIGPKWQALREAQKLAGDAISDMTFSNTEKASAKRLYALLSEDVEKATQDLVDQGIVSQEAKDLFDAAKKTTIERKIVEANFEELFGSQLERVLDDPILAKSPENWVTKRTLGDTARTAINKAKTDNIHALDKMLSAIPKPERADMVKNSLAKALVSGGSKLEFGKSGEMYDKLKNSKEFMDVFGEAAKRLPTAMKAVDNIGQIMMGASKQSDKSPAAVPKVLEEIASRNVGKLTWLWENMAGTIAAGFGLRSKEIAEKKLGIFTSAGGQTSVAQNMAAFSMARSIFNPNTANTRRINALQDLMASDEMMEALTSTNLDEKAIDALANSKRLKNIFKRVKNLKTDRAAEDAIRSVMRGMEEHYND